MADFRTYLEELPELDIRSERKGRHSDLREETKEVLFVKEVMIKVLLSGEGGTFLERRSRKSGKVKVDWRCRLLWNLERVFIPILI